MRTNITPPQTQRTQEQFDGMTPEQLGLWQFANTAHWEEGHGHEVKDGIWADYTGRFIQVGTDASNPLECAVWVEFCEYKYDEEGNAVLCPNVDRLWGNGGRVWFARPPMARKRDGDRGPWDGYRSALQPLDDAIALHGADDALSVMLRITATGTDH